MTLNEYQHRAMSTCMDSCNNIAYMLTGLNAEIGEVNDKKMTIFVSCVIWLIFAMTLVIQCQIGVE